MIKRPSLVAIDSEGTSAPYSVSSLLPFSSKIFCQTEIWMIKTFKVWSQGNRGSGLRWNFLRKLVEQKTNICFCISRITFINSTTKNYYRQRINLTRIIRIFMDSNTWKSFWLDRFLYGTSRRMGCHWRIRRSWRNLKVWRRRSPFRINTRP